MFPLRSQGGVSTYLSAQTASERDLEARTAGARAGLRSAVCREPGTGAGRTRIGWEPAILMAPVEMAIGWRGRPAGELVEAGCSFGGGWRPAGVRLGSGWGPALEADRGGPGARRAWLQVIGRDAGRFPGSSPSGDPKWRQSRRASGRRSV